jgi:hypothetical protein
LSKTAKNFRILHIAAEVGEVDLPIKIRSIIYKYQEYKNKIKYLLIKDPMSSVATDDGDYSSQTLTVKGISSTIYRRAVFDISFA